MPPGGFPHGSASQFYLGGLSGIDFLSFSRNDPPSALRPLNGRASPIMRPLHSLDPSFEQDVYRYASVVIAGLAIAFGAGHTLHGFPASVPAASVERILRIVNSFSFAGLALLFAWKSERREAWVVGLSLAAINLNGHKPEHPLGMISYVVACVAFLRSTQIFPNPLTPDDLRSLSRFEWVSKGFAFWLRPLNLWLWFGGLLVFATEIVGLSSTMPNIVILAFGLTGMWANYRTSDETDRRRLFWILQATVWSLCIRIFRASLKFLAASLDLDLPDRLWTWAWLTHDLGVTAFFLLAVFYAGAISARLVLRKTAVYSLSISILIFLFAVVENYLSGYLSEQLGLEDRIVSAMTGAAVGLTFNPLREGLNRIALRLLGKTAPTERSPVPILGAASQMEETA